MDERKAGLVARGVRHGRGRLGEYGAGQVREWLYSVKSGRRLYRARPFEFTVNSNGLGIGACKTRGKSTSRDVTG